MEVGVSDLRADLALWLRRVRSGEQVLITDRGVPVARLTAVDTAPLIDQLTRDGILAKPILSARPKASAMRRVKARGSVSDLVSEERR